MLDAVQALKEVLGKNSLPSSPYLPEHFQTFRPQKGREKVAFVDGGQAEVLQASSFCLSFLRCTTVIFQENRRLSSEFWEFFALIFLKEQEKKNVYEVHLFPVRNSLPFSSSLLTFSGEDDSLREGWQNPSWEKIAAAVRRLGELAIARACLVEVVVVDGVLEQTFRAEGPYLSKSDRMVSLAKTSSLFSVSHNPVRVFQQGPEGCWVFPYDEKNSWVKLHPQAQQAWRFMGNRDVLPLLAEGSKDASFLGYPYGLVVADQLARVSQQEKALLRMRILAREASWLEPHLATQNSHEILDRMKY